MSASRGSAAYAAWVEQLINRGLEPWLATFMFRQLPGPAVEIERTMLQVIERFYGIRITRVIKHPRARRNRDRRPILLGAIDLPIYKHVKQSLRDVLVNDGRHAHAIVLECQDRRCSESLAEFIFKDWRLIQNICPELERIDVRAITHDIPQVTGYVFKAIEKRVSADAVLILPRTDDELRDKKARTGGNSSRFGTSKKCRRP